MRPHPAVLHLLHFLKVPAMGAFAHLLAIFEAHVQINVGCSLIPSSSVTSERNLRELLCKSRTCCIKACLAYLVGDQDVSPKLTWIGLQIA